MSEVRPTVLVVDDSDLFRYSFKNILKDFDLNVVACFDGLDGIRKAMEYKPVLIILDLMMPNFDGIKMLQVIKVIEELKTIPVVVISGNTNRSNVIAALENGAEKVFSKPLQQELILKYLKDLLGDQLVKRTPSTGDSEEIKSNKDLVNHLSRFFLNNFHPKKEKLLEALVKENKELLSEIIHEIKGAGGTIGYLVISLMCYDIEKSLNGDYPDWLIIKNKCSKLLNVIEQIKIPAEIQEN